MVQRISKQLGGTGVDNSGTIHVDSANNRFGVGIETPSDVVHTDGAIRIQGAGTAYYIRIDPTLATSGYVNEINHTDVGLEFDNNTDSRGYAWSVNGSEKMRIDSSGYIGINQASPSGLLHVSGGAASSGIILDSNTGFATLTLSADSTNTGGGGVAQVRFELAGTQQGRIGFNPDGDFSITTGIASGTEVLNITNAGALSLSSGVAIDSILDEDNFASNSATALATQQSIKAYINDNLPDLTQANIRADGVLAPHHNLVLQNGSTAATQVDITADGLIVTDASGNQALLESVSETASIGSSGAGGLDTGSEANSTFYHVWIIYDGTNTDALLSTSATFAGLTLPGGYTHAAYCGAMYNDSSGDFLDMSQKDRWVVVNDFTDQSNIDPASWTSYTVTVPTTAVAWIGWTRSASDGGNDTVVRVASTTEPLGEQRSGMFNAGGISTASFIIPLIVEQKIAVRCDNCSDTDINTTGWVF